MTAQGAEGGRQEGVGAWVERECEGVGVDGGGRSVKRWSSSQRSAPALGANGRQGGRRAGSGRGGAMAACGRRHTRFSAETQLLGRCAGHASTVAPSPSLNFSRAAMPSARRAGTRQAPPHAAIGAGRCGGVKFAHRKLGSVGRNSRRPLLLECRPHRVWLQVAASCNTSQYKLGLFSKRGPGLHELA